MARSCVGMRVDKHERLIEKNNSRVKREYFDLCLFHLPAASHEAREVTRPLPPKALSKPSTGTKKLPHKRPKFPPEDV